MTGAQSGVGKVKKAEGRMKKWDRINATFFILPSAFLIDSLSRTAVPNLSLYAAWMWSVLTAALNSCTPMAMPMMAIA